VVVLNRTARNVIEAKRGVHDKYVFTYRGERMDRIGNTAWKRAWRKAALPVLHDVQKGPHNLRHTFGRRLRAVGVPLETRKVLLGHTNGDITTHYSAAELAELIDAVERITSNSGKNPAATILRRSLGVVTG
jgi:integrase